MFGQSRGLKQRVSLTAGHWLIQRRSDDRYIFSYPRSGNTWLRTMLAYLLRPDAASNPEIRDALISGVSIRKAFHINTLPSPRFISSHSWYRRGIPTAVYLVRDGRDVLVSYYHYRVTRRGRAEEESFSEFFDRYCQGAYGHLWHENVESWLGEGRSIMGERLMQVRFEDLKQETEVVLGEIAHFLEIPTSPDQLREAIEAASLERMRKVERSRLGELANSDMSFYRGGRSGQWSDYFDTSIEQRFYAVSSNALRLAGYDF